MTPWPDSRWRVCLLTLLVLCSLCAPPVAATGSSHAPQHAPLSEQAALESGVYQQQNNTTVQHENPDSANQDGNLDGLESHLARILAERLGQSSVQLSQGEYDQARQLVGDDYSDALGKYVDVAGDTGNERTADRFERTQDTQQNYTTTVSEFRQTYDAYQEAKQNGNEQRARELARELTNLAQRSNRQSTQLNQSYTRLSNQTGADFTEAQESVDEIQQNISTQEQSVLEEEFTPTELDVEVSQSQISFQEPLQVSGQLAADDGSALADQTIRVETGGRNVTTTTDADGTFSLTHRPTVLPLSTENVTVRYVPESSSIYLGANETVDIAVTQTEATLQLSETPSTTAYGEDVTVAGDVAVDDTAVSSMPVTVSIGATPIGTTRTTADGSFQFQTTLPANVSAGSHNLRVRLGVQDRAVTASPATKSVQVERTPTELTLDTNASGGRSIPVSGQFQTTDGRTVGGQQLKFLVNGTLVGTTTTNPDGTYQSQVRVPQEVVTDGSTDVRLAAVYTGEGTNLESARAKATVTVTVASGDVTGDLPVPGTDSNLVYWVGGGLIAIALLAGGGFLYLRRSTTDALSATQSTEAVDPTQTQSTPTETDTSLLELARERVASGQTETAIEAAYEAIRHRFATSLGLGSAATHWELYHAYRAQIGDHASTLQEVVERYERAVYGPDTPSADDASTAISLSVDVLNSQDQSTDDD